ncbi:glycine betaine/L-proline ABC transporter substrate-binding protein ProX [Halodesulfovibrio marinisediminis]|uniref:Glycine betaine/proline transport system substrate-binding protein n=1 Tax=Halodesulfovibrio marinisediminis DSM 17456 TaxID=1121457 RepID=A0A1N6DL80_9BACT|nr:glycine betaine/L-proline ABC transporter substrate-binding protein ProX [Halodesulfovibrio marinisediminis]SIN71433.1 glycine betaine/proline transport system substrate-binding protein [Halodesulfovibrio marinisediminis DSM 17456]
MIKKFLLTLLILSMSIPAFAVNPHPGKGITIRPARATWTTGYFHAVIIEKGLRELGYTVEKTKELPVALFFKSLTLGDVDYWPNGWFPLYENHLNKYKDSISAIGYVLKKQALQGYLVDKKHAESLNIKSLEDFKRPEVRKAFDKDGDGKADLTGAPHGWNTVKVIQMHIEKYGLKDHVEQVSASYQAAMAANIASYKSGEPIFYYTWTPSWTVYRLVPGKDVVWINVPFNIPNTDSKEELELMHLKDVEGAATNPIDMGFSVANIRVVANNKFLEQNPPAKKFLELFTIDLSDLNEQYAKLMRGEKSMRDINRHADEWIENNQDTWNNWLDQARRTVE